MITGADYVISARMGTREPELVLDIYPRRGYTWCMGATETPDLTGSIVWIKLQELSDRYGPRLRNESYLLEAIEDALGDRELADWQVISLIRLVIQRGQDLLNEPEPED